MAIRKLTKGAGETLVYDWDASKWLAEEGLTIQSFALTVEDGITLVSSSNTDTSVLMTLSGGTLGRDYTIKNVITAQISPAVILERFIVIQIQRR